MASVGVEGLDAWLRKNRRPAPPPRAKRPPREKATPVERSREAAAEADRRFQAYRAAVNAEFARVAADAPAVGRLSKVLRRELESGDDLAELDWEHLLDGLGLTSPHAPDRVRQWALRLAFRALRRCRELHKRPVFDDPLPWPLAPQKIETAEDWVRRLLRVT